VLSRCPKTESDSADATWRGRLFQTVAPETGNVHLPTVDLIKDITKERNTICAVILNLCAKLFFPS